MLTCKAAIRGLAVASLVAVPMLVVSALAAPSPAEAGGWHRSHHHHHHYRHGGHGRSHFVPGLALGLGIGALGAAALAAPYYYAPPPPVYYAPAPVYHYPPPVYYYGYPR